MKILLSPAKSIDCNIKTPTSAFTTPLFASDAEKLAKKLAKKSVKDLSALFHVSQTIAELNVQRFQNFQLTDKATENNQPAGFIFTGEVYKGLDLHSLNKKKWSFAQDSIRILSGLYGILRPFDLIYPYRLEMGTKWAITPTTTNLYKFWGDRVLKSLEQEMKADDLIINLASTEYFKVLGSKKIKHRVITPIFKDFKGDSYKVIMMYAKHARGAMARYIVENQISDPEKLKLYEVDGYRFHEKLSQGDEWVFTR
jgi:cytoplasmic iron level regulating protein YaaA (DUF328/UPF0246 family)